MLKSKIKNPPERKIAVVGLGYVGLPLSLQFASAGIEVIGLDIDPVKVGQLKAGKSYIRHIPEERIRNLWGKGFFHAVTDFSLVSEVSAVIICVPTPLNKYREPDLSYVCETARAIAPYLKKGSLVVLESTTYPGTTEGELRAILEENSGMEAGKDFHLAYSPEREDPGNPESKVENMPKIVGGLTPACLEKAIALYALMIERLVPVSTCRTAEAAKLLENIFRAVNIALVNELKVVYDEMKIDIWEVIKAAETKPFGFMPFYPGPGLGGHCIPVDPFYLTWKAREFGQHTRFIELAGEINSSMARYVVSRVREMLNKDQKAVNGAKILVLGLAYKPNVDDMRESPTFRLLNLLKKGGAAVDYYDPYIPVIPPSRENASWAGTKSISWEEKAIAAYDLVLISTAHDLVNYEELGNWAKRIVDSRNIMESVSACKAKVWKA